MTEPPETTNWFHALAEAEAELDAGFAGLPGAPEPALGETGRAVLRAAALRLRENYPYGHPLYAGQMLKPPHPVARAAYALAMRLNPNNHALDGGRASSYMEMEAVAAIAQMFGWPQGEFLGHLTSGGTFANLEALWVAGQLAPGKAIAASDQAHYTHARISGVLGLPFVSLATDAQGRIEVEALERRLADGNEPAIGCIVATLGTTAIGAVDPLDRLLPLAERHGLRVHVDAAYGGYFTLAGNLAPAARTAFDAIRRADSVVIDPHKHGLQPYGCGCVLFRDPAVGRFYKHDSPYTYFSSSELHLGEVSLECSRAGASAVALWATQQLLPYTAGGEFAAGLDSGRQAALALWERLGGDSRFVRPIAPPELDIVFWAVRGSAVEQSSASAQAVFDECARRDLHLALAKLPVRFFADGTWPEREGYVTCLRSVQMKPEHLTWGEEIWARLQASSGAVLGG